MPNFWDISALRTILDSETDYDSPGSEELVSQIRENLEALFLLLFKVEAGTATSDPSDNSNGYFYDSAAGWTDDEHNGRTLLITSGNAKGNYYTIDDTVAASDRVACTGDNLYADGVRSADAYIILYDLQNSHGHDHDGINSKSVVLENGAVTENKLASSAVSRTKLKSDTSEVSTTSSSMTNLNPTGVGSYGFYPQFKTSNVTTFMAARLLESSFNNTSYTQEVALQRTSGAGTVYAQFRYITSSGEIFWIFFLCDKKTSEIISASAAPDHVCFGAGGDPEKTAHPFVDYNPQKHLIVVVNPFPTQLAQMKKRSAGRGILQTILEDYEIDFAKNPKWPDIPVTVAIKNEDQLEPGKMAEVIKKIIPQPDFIRTAAIKLRKKQS